MGDSTLIGVWRLVAWEANTSDGETSYPMGRNLTGYITYTEDGYMNVIISKLHRTPFQSGDLFGGSWLEKQSIADSFLAYAGKYAAEGNIVRHDVEVCSFPNWVGGVQERTADWTENRLILSTRPIPVQGQTQTNRLIWERV